MTRVSPRRWSASFSVQSASGRGMGQVIGRIEILPDPLALARHVAEWMTAAALAANGPFRVSLSGGSTPKALYGLLASDEFGAVSPGSSSRGIGGMSASFPMTIPKAIIGWPAKRCWPRRLYRRRTFTPCRPTEPPRTPLGATNGPAGGLWRGGPRSGPPAVRRDAARPRSRRPYGLAAARRPRAGGAQAAGWRLSRTDGPRSASP